MKTKATAPPAAPRIQMLYDVSAVRANAISTYYHCARCLAEMPAGVSPQQWARTQSGITAAGAIQVWCTRHDVNIAHITPHVAGAAK